MVAAETNETFLTSALKDEFVEGKCDDKEFEILIRTAVDEDIRGLAETIKEYARNQPQERYEAFTLELREHLQKKYLDTLIVYADWLSGENEFNQAIEVLESGLRYDQLWSEGVQN
jgi:two-component SAPR family response regulator